VACAKLDLHIPIHLHAAVLKYSDNFIFTAHDFSKPSPYCSIKCIMRSRYYLDLPGWTEESHNKP